MSAESSSFLLPDIPTEDDLFDSLRLQRPIPGFLIRRRDGKVTAALEVIVTKIRYAGDNAKWWFEAVIVEVRQGNKTIEGPDDALIKGLWTASGTSYVSRFPTHEFLLEENAVE